MRIRQITTALAVVAVFGLTACSAEQAGSAAAASAGASQGGAGEPGESSADRSTAESTEPADGSGPVESIETSDSSDTAESSPESSTEESSTSSAESSAEGPVQGTASATGTGSAGASGAADNWPADLCKLMPGKLTNGLEKQDGDPQLRCMYSDMVDHKFTSVMIYKGAFSIDPDDPSGSNSGKEIKAGTVDGRKAWSWLNGNANGATAAFDSGEKGSAYASVSNEAKDPEENRKAALALAEQFSKALKGGNPAGGAVTAPPSTSHPKVPAGTRAWPHIICDLAPEKMLKDMEKARGYETQSCRLSSDTKDGFVKVDISQAVRPTDPTNPAGKIGEKQKKESFDGRVAYSYLETKIGSSDVQTAYVSFDTGGRKWLTVRVTEADVVTPVAAAKVRADALALAQEIAPKLPKP